MGYIERKQFTTFVNRSPTWLSNKDRIKKTRPETTTMKSILHSVRQRITATEKIPTYAIIYYYRYENCIAQIYVNRTSNEKKRKKKTYECTKVRIGWE